MKRHANIASNRFNIIQLLLPRDLFSWMSILLRDENVYLLFWQRFSPQTTYSLGTRFSWKTTIGKQTNEIFTRFVLVVLVDDRGDEVKFYKQSSATTMKIITKPRLIGPWTDNNELFAKRNEIRQLSLTDEKRLNICSVNVCRASHCVCVRGIDRLQPHVKLTLSRSPAPSKRGSIPRKTKKRVMAVTLNRRKM